MLLLPPRWCCAIPGIQAECCEACQAQADAGESCCACQTETEVPQQEAPQQPCKCLCHDQLAQLAKGSDLDSAIPVALSHALPILTAATASNPCFLAVQILPPHDVQSRLCRWLI
jgi:hypothetical protein